MEEKKNNNSIEDAPKIEIPKSYLSFVRDDNVLFRSHKVGNRRNDSTSTPKFGITLTAMLQHMSSELTEQVTSTATQVCENISNSVLAYTQQPEMGHEYSHEFEIDNQNKNRGDSQDSDDVTMVEQSEFERIEDLDAKIRQIEEAICEINTEFIPMDCVCEGIQPNQKSSDLNFRSRMLIDEFPPRNGSRNPQFNVAPVTMFGSLLNSIIHKNPLSTNAKADDEKEANQRVNILKKDDF